MFEEYDINQLQEKALSVQGPRGVALQEELARRLQAGEGIEPRLQDAKEWVRYADLSRKALSEEQVREAAEQAAQAKAAQERLQPKAQASAPSAIESAIQQRKAQDAQMQAMVAGALYCKVLQGDLWARYWYAMFFFTHNEAARAVQEWQALAQLIEKNAHKSLPQAVLFCWRVQAKLAECYLKGTGVAQDIAKGTQLAQAALEIYDDAQLRALLL